MFEGQVDSSKRNNLLYDDVKRHFHVITDLNAAVAINYACKVRNKSCRPDVTHACDYTCSDCWAAPVCILDK